MNTLAFFKDDTRSLFDQYPPPNFHDNVAQHFSQMRLVTVYSACLYSAFMFIVSSFFFFFVKGDFKLLFIYLGCAARLVES